MKIEVYKSLNQISSDDWNSCSSPEKKVGRPNDPFTSYEFLKALEDSNSVGKGTGWEPLYIAVYQERNLIGCAPMYLKYHSQGEYIFDHNWAYAYESAGGQYYPKLQISAPFTPVTGKRFLVLPGFEEKATNALVKAAIEIASKNSISSLHVTFCTEAEKNLGEKLGLLTRTSQQFHWQNKNYSTFDDFLSALSSRKRKNIRKERLRANSFGGKIYALTGHEMRPEHWDAFWNFYQATGRKKWGHPYLTREFFDIVHSQMKDITVMFFAERDNKYVAGALNFLGKDTLYGRYWGCIEDHEFLHFEACYYRAIEFAISNGIKKVEAGAQGEHKLARGYMPVETYSLHWILEENFRKAVEAYLKAEKKAVKEAIDGLANFAPFKKIDLGEY